MSFIHASKGNLRNRDVEPNIDQELGPLEVQEQRGWHYSELVARKRMMAAPGALRGDGLLLTSEYDALSKVECWKRLWIVPEILAATALHVSLGDEVTSWLDLTRLVEISERVALPRIPQHHTTTTTAGLSFMT